MIREQNVAGKRTCTTYSNGSGKVNVQNIGFGHVEMIVNKSVYRLFIRYCFNKKNKSKNFIVSVKHRLELWSTFFIFIYLHSSCTIKFLYFFFFY